MMANPQTHASASTHLAVNTHYLSHHPHRLPRAHLSPIPHQGSVHYRPNSLQDGHPASSSASPPPHNHGRNSNPPPFNLPSSMLHRRSTAVGISGGNAPSGYRPKDDTTRVEQMSMVDDFSSHVVTTNSIDFANKHIINQYVIIRRVGKGQHGFVFEARDTVNNRTVVSWAFIAVCFICSDVLCSIICIYPHFQGYQVV